MVEYRVRERSQDDCESIQHSSSPRWFRGFAAQWAIFDKGNFSETAGPVFIPLLGEHGIYTSTPLGGAWYLGLTLFSLGTLTWAVAWLIERNRRRS
jgi:hypothetical protein